MVREVTLNHKLLNGGKETKIICDYDEDYFRQQFNEIFIGEMYKGGRRKGKVLIDCGANIGLSVLYFKDYFDIIYAIEPNDIYYQFLVENTKDHSNIKTFHLGLGMENKQLALISNPNEERTESVWGTGENGQVFNCLTLNTFMEQQKIKHADVMKIDCEGAEYLVFTSKDFAKAAKKIDFIVGEGHNMGSMDIDFIPIILKDVGFKTKFLPFKNTYKTLSFNNEDGKPITKIYKRMIQSMFEASK